MSTLAKIFFAFPILTLAASAHADSGTFFGPAPRSMALMRADIAETDATTAPIQNAALTATAGTRFRLGYVHGLLDLRISGQKAPVRNVAGVDAGAQMGFRLPRGFIAGFALSAHLPNSGLAQIGFRPGTEPQFFRYESVLQRAAFNMTVAARKGPFSIGLGTAFSLAMGGSGTSFALGQDAQGSYADAASDISLDYQVAPIVGLSLDLGRLALGATYRGALAVGLLVDSDIRISLAENPLNGTTAITVRGSSGYDPARFAFGGKFLIHQRFAVFGALELERHSAAPPPVADVKLDVNLGVSPGRTEVEFVGPRFRDILIPRLGIEWSSARGQPGSVRKKGDQRLRWAIRAGYAFEPSPVPPQNGFTSYADAASHALALGAGIGLGRAWGVDLRLDVATRASFLVPRMERKPSPALPYAAYEVSGQTFVGTLALEGAFR